MADSTDRERLRPANCGRWRVDNDLPLADIQCVRYHER